jgi:hypothetical protein
MQSEKQKQFQVTDYITTSKIQQQNSTQKLKKLILKHRNLETVKTLRIRSF